MFWVFAIGLLLFLASKFALEYLAARAYNKYAQKHDLEILSHAPISNGMGLTRVENTLPQDGLRTKIAIMRWAAFGLTLSYWAVLWLAQRAK
jgi:hypothetical protein